MKLIPEYTPLGRPSPFPLVMAEKRCRPWLDLLRMAMIYLAVSRHVWPDGSENVHWALRQVIMVLFVISGYLLTSPDGSVSLSKITHVMKRILHITIWAQLIYIVIFLADNYFNDLPRFYSYIGAMGNWVNVVMVGDSVVPHLWYLNTYLIALGLLWIIIKWRMELPMIIIMAGAYVFGLLAGTYTYATGIDSEIVKIWSLHRTALNMSLPALMCGVALRRYEYILPSLPVMTIIFLISTGCIIAESITISHQVDWSMLEYYTLSLPASVITVAFMLRLPEKGKMLESLSRICYRYALPLYLWHFVAKKIVDGLKIFPDDGNFINVVVIIILTLLGWELLHQAWRIIGEKIQKKTLKVLRG